MNLYEILHISQDAPIEIVKLAYKGLAQKYHPDRYEGEDAHEIMVKIREAYEVLSDPLKRKKYDYFLAEEAYRKKATLKESSQQKFKKEDNDQSFNFKISIDISHNLSLFNSFGNFFRKNIKSIWINRKRFLYICLVFIGVLILLSIINITTNKSDVVSETYNNEQKKYLIDSESQNRDRVELSRYDDAQMLQSENASEQQASIDMLDTQTSSTNNYESTNLYSSPKVYSEIEIQEADQAAAEATKAAEEATKAANEATMAALEAKIGAEDVTMEY